MIPRTLFKNFTLFSNKSTHLFRGNVLKTSLNMTPQLHFQLGRTHTHNHREKLLQNKMNNVSMLQNGLADTFEKFNIPPKKATQICTILIAHDIYNYDFKQNDCKLTCIYETLKDIVEKSDLAYVSEEETRLLEYFKYTIESLESSKNDANKEQIQIDRIKADAARDARRMVDTQRTPYGWPSLKETGNYDRVLKETYEKVCAAKYLDSRIRCFNAYDNAAKESERKLEPLYNLQKLKDEMAQDALKGKKKEYFARMRLADKNNSCFTPLMISAINDVDYGQTSKLNIYDYKNCINSILEEIKIKLDNPQILQRSSFKRTT